MYILYMKLYLYMLCKIWSINKIKKRVQKKRVSHDEYRFQKKREKKQNSEKKLPKKKIDDFCQDSQAHNHNVSSIIFKYIFLRYTFSNIFKKISKIFEYTIFID